jgi:glycosyltransferase involved in cell wall biosynthesis
MRKSLLITAFEKIELFLYRRATAIVSVTESFRDDLVGRGIDGRKVHVVRNGVDLDRYGPRVRDAELARETGLEGRFVAGYIGTHGMAHALQKVLDSAELLRDRRDIAFFFAGSGAERARVEQRVAERGLDNVKLIPRQPKERMPSLWSLCDVALVPLKDAPVFSTVIPSKIFESMGMGVPLLMSVPEGEATAIVKATGSGLCVQPESPHAMADAIRELAGNPEQMLKLRRSAEAAAPQFSRDALATRMLLIMQKVAERSGN